MIVSKGRLIQEVQRFGGAMYTPGRTPAEVEDKLFSKAEYKAKQQMEARGLADDELAFKAQVFLDALGGPDNIREVTNCATRLRVTAGKTPVLVF